MAAYLFLHVGRRLQIRLEGRGADCCRFAVAQLVAVRYASSCRASRHSAEIGDSGFIRRFCSPSFPESDAAAAFGRSAFLSGFGHAWRMGHVGQLLQRCAGFPYRASGHVVAGVGRIWSHQVYHPEIRRRKNGRLFAVYDGRRLLQKRRIRSCRLLSLFFGCREFFRCSALAVLQKISIFVCFRVKKQLRPCKTLFIYMYIHNIRFLTDRRPFLVW